MDDLPCYVEGQPLHCNNDDHDEDDVEEDINEDINLSASVDFSIERINININQMRNTASHNCEQPLGIEEQQNLSESLKPTEEYYENLSYSSRNLLELSEFNDDSQSPKRVTEYRRVSTSLSSSSCSEDGGMEQATLKSTPKNYEVMADGLLLSPEVEVINLCTPSSGIIRSKTKRALFDSVIIDLTDSPMVIEL